MLITSCGENALSVTPSVHPDHPLISEIINHPRCTYLHSLTKAQYYALLARARYYLSTSITETFGYSFHEAKLYQCECYVPNRGCYPEFTSVGIYESIDTVPEMMAFGVGIDPDPKRWQIENGERIVEAVRHDVRVRREFGGNQR